MITFRSTLEGITPDQLSGFFEGWPSPPSRETHLRILRNSDEVVIAIDDASGKVVGFINALTDGILSAYIPLLEVLNAYRGRGIGRQLATRMLVRLSDYYMVDLLCDEELRKFYRKLGMREAGGMMMRNYNRQAGKPESTSP